MINGGIISMGASGALNPDSVAAQQHADLYYEEIRKRTSDIARIAKNTGFSKRDVELIKNHIFINEHRFADGRVRRFDTSYHQAQAWQRLEAGKHTDTDVAFLRHELIEQEFMANGDMYEIAHAKANEQYDWQELIKG